MSDSKPKDKRRQKKTGSKELRDAKIRAMAASGKTTVEIAAEVGIQRQRVSKILNSGETKALVTQAENELKDMVGEALETFRYAMSVKDQPFPGALAGALKSATTILTSLGIVKQKVDLAHSFPKPVVIRRPNGEIVELGVEEEK